MSYLIRTDTGVMTAVIDNGTAKKIMDGVRGHFEHKNFTNGTKKLCFVIDTGSTFVLENKGWNNPFMVRVMLFEGYYLTEGDFE